MRSARISCEASRARIPRPKSTAPATRGEGDAESEPAPAPGCDPVGRAGWTRGYSPSTPVFLFTPLCGTEHRQLVLRTRGRRPRSRPGCLSGVPVTPVSWGAPPFASTDGIALPSLPCPPEGRAKHFRAEQWVGLSSPFRIQKDEKGFLWLVP